MLLVATFLAVLLLAFAAFCAFGMPYMLMGARAFEERADLRVMAAGLGAICVLLAALPFAASGLISSGPPMQVFADTFVGASGRHLG
jgi:hypothetical protein